MSAGGWRLLAWLALAAGCDTRSFGTGAGADAGALADAGDQFEVFTTGGLTIEQERAPEVWTAVWGYFREAPEWPAPATMRVGPCDVVDRIDVHQPPRPPTPPPPRYLKAGRFVLSSGSTVVELDTDPTGQSGYHKRQPALVWSPDQSITLSWTGAEVPAFSGAVVMPADVTLTYPAGRVELSRDQPLSVRWSVAGATGNVDVWVSQSSHVGIGMRYSYASCLAPARDGQTVIPAEALRALQPTDATRATVIVHSRASTLFRAGAIPVRVTAQWRSPTYGELVWR